jgi:hypothetical protein
VRVMSGEWWNDDATLLARLREAHDAARQVPPEFIAAAKAVWVPPDVDAELAELVYDSQREPMPVRADTAALRALSFVSAAQAIELEITDDAIRGQLVPPCRGEIRIEQRGGDTVEVTTDDLGYFRIPLVPAGHFRLRCRTGTGVDVVTNWIAI